MQVPLFRLQCGVNSYAWGKIGSNSAAAKCAASTQHESAKFSIEEGKPYAEIWMGTHPTLPSRDLHTQRSLLDLIDDNEALVSRDISQKYDKKLPFLLKVLSIQKALSIQAHPNKKLAAELHAKDPAHYPDDNHKPEMALALTPFEALCGFRPLAEISHFLSTVSQLRKLVGESAVKEFQEAIRGKESSEDAHDMKTNRTALQAVFSALMHYEKDEVISAAEELVSSAKQEGAKFAGGGSGPTDGQELAEIIIRLNDQFTGDIGLFVFFFLNYVKLEPGEAMFLKADDIHAYISGDIIECMASSDNVVRAGFSPKFQDIPTLISMLTYNYAPISSQKMAPVDYPYVTLNQAAYSSSSSAILYDPPIEEFGVVMTNLKTPGAKATFEPIQGPSIIICTGGEGTIAVGPKVEEVNYGYIYFVGATAECVLESKGQEAEGEGFVTFKAFCELGEKDLANGDGNGDGDH